MNRLDRTLASLFLVISLAFAACTDDAGNDPTADAAPGDPDATTNGDAAPAGDAAPLPGGFVTIIARDFSVAPGTETYRCTRLTVTQDMYVTGFRALAPLGTHHTVLSVNANPTAADGDYNCGPGNISHAMLFASGVGTDDLLLPEGVAIPVRAGSQLDLNLHLFNVSNSTISGTSGTQVTLVPAQDVAFEAEVVFGGTYNIFLPSSPGTEQTVSGGCRFQSDATVFALWPHMHQLGRRMRVDLEAANGTTPLLDMPFNFEEQLNYPIAPVSVNAGERLNVDCVYVNDTGGLVTFGDSSDAEMCFVGVYRYPATNAGAFSCVGS